MTMKKNYPLIRNMFCWIVKTEVGREVVSAEYAEKKDEVYMFLDGERILNMRRERGLFMQVKRGENFHGPFDNRSQALDYAETL